MVSQSDRRRACDQPNSPFCQSAGSESNILPANVVAPVEGQETESLARVAQKPTRFTNAPHHEGFELSPQGNLIFHHKTTMEATTRPKLPPSISPMSQDRHRRQALVESLLIPTAAPSPRMQSCSPGNVGSSADPFCAIQKELFLQSRAAKLLIRVTTQWTVQPKRPWKHWLHV